MRNDNRVVVDLNKAQHALLFYINQFGDKRKLPLKHSSRGYAYDPDVVAVRMPDIGEETMEQRAVRLGVKDECHPVLRLKLTANGYLYYHCDKAMSIYKEWCSRIFKRTKTK